MSQRTWSDWIFAQGGVKVDQLAAPQFFQLCARISQAPYPSFCSSIDSSSILSIYFLPAWQFLDHILSFLLTSTPHLDHCFVFPEPLFVSTEGTRSLLVSLLDLAPEARVACSMNVQLQEVLTF